MDPLPAGASRTLRELVAAGAIGEVLLVQADFGAQRDLDPTSRLFDLRARWRPMLDLGVYPISLAQHFLGRPDRVTSTGTTVPQRGRPLGGASSCRYDDGRRRRR